MNDKINSNGHKPARKNKRPKWTVMVYLAGDNNLTANCITVLQQLEAVKYKDDIRVLACFDSNTPWPKGSRYLAVNGKFHENDEHLDWEIYNDLILTKNRNHEVNAPDFCRDEDTSRGRPMQKTDVAEGLKRFLRWAMRHPSDRYMLVLYGHGPVVAGKTFLSQENPVSSLRMKDLPELLEPHFGVGKRNLDILAFQNCAMNGVETAYEVKDQVDYMIGSQGLVLSYGWPYDKIIGAVAENPNARTAHIARKMLKACARHLIDFSVMDRSSEQSACDLSKMRNGANITEAIYELSGALRGALAFHDVVVHRKGKDSTQKQLKHPAICDAVRLARLEAQSYWGETFVDVYDFCERLLKKCNEAYLVHKRLISSLGVNGSLETRFAESDFVAELSNIMVCCNNVMDRVKEMVPYSYYIGSELQYSHGLSIYFPWSMPREPYSFYFKKKEKEHVLVTAFESYSSYEFCKQSGWADFLKSFYRATLRRVRRADRTFVMRNANTFSGGMVRELYHSPDPVVTTEYLQKTDSNSGSVDYDVWSYVKNYPRRNYLSPSDCPLKVAKTDCHVAGQSPNFPDIDSPPVSYLGWNICKFVADVIVKRDDRKNGSRKKKRRSQQHAGNGRLQRGAPAVRTGTRRP